jgi:GTP-binding protein
MLTNVKNLAKTSATPGKTQLINHFMVNNNWYLVDLPGYGFAKVSKSLKTQFEKIISDYILKRKNLMTVFVLVDVRHKPLSNDLQFINWLGEHRIPFSIVFTKSDKLKKQELKRNTDVYKAELSKTWEELPPLFLASSVTRTGKDEILNYIEATNELFDIP